MNTSYSDQVKIDSYSHEYLQQILELCHNLTLDNQLTILAQEITRLIRNRKIHSTDEADKYIQNKVHMFKKYESIITVYNPQNSKIQPQIHFFANTKFSEIKDDTELNRIGISVLPLKSKKVIFAVLFAEIEENNIASGIRSIVKRCSGKIPNLSSFSVVHFGDLVNSFRSIFQLPEVKIENTFIGNDIQNDENEFIEVEIPVRNDQDVLLSCLLVPTFIQFIFSPIEFISVKPESSESKIYLRSKRIKNAQNNQINDQGINIENNSKQVQNESLKPNINNVNQQSPDTGLNPEKSIGRDRNIEELITTKGNENETDQQLETAEPQIIEEEEEDKEPEQQQQHSILTKEEPHESLEKQTAELNEEKFQTQSTPEEPQVIEEEEDKEPEQQPTINQPSKAHQENYIQSQPIKPVNSIETSQEKHITINKIPNSKPISRESEDNSLTFSPKPILTTPKKEQRQGYHHILDENDLVNTKTDNNNNDNNNVEKATDIDNNANNDINNNNIDDNKDINEDEAELPIDLDAPCLSTSDCVRRSIQIYNSCFNITNTQKPIKEMSDRLLHFMEENADNFKKAVTPQTTRALFDSDIIEYKKSFVFYDLEWKELHRQLEKKPPSYNYASQSTKENVIFAIASTIQKGSDQSNPKFNLVYVTRSSEVNINNQRNFSQSEFYTPNPKAQTQTFNDRTPIKQIASLSFQNISKTPNHNSNQPETPNPTSIPSRYSEDSQKLEYEIANILRGLRKGNSLVVDTELSNQLRNTLQENRGKEWTHPEFKEMFETEDTSAWARLYFNTGYNELIKKVKHEYKAMFMRKIILAKSFIIAAIQENEETNTFTAVVISESIKTNKDKDTDNNQKKEASEETTTPTTPVSNLNLFEVKGSATSSNGSFNLSANSSGSQTPRGSTRKRGGPKREIGDFERSRLFLEQFNQYRKSIGKDPLELNVKLIEPAKHLSKVIMQSFSLVNPQPYIDEAYNIPGVENVMTCSAFTSKSNDYVKRCFDQMLNKFKAAVESDNDKIAVAYWNDENKNVSVACFLFRLKGQ